MSSIYKRKSDNLWVGIANITDKNGKRKRKTFYAPTHLDDKKAEAYLARKIREAEFLSEHNVYSDPGAATIKSLLDEYFEHHKRIAPTTQALYKMYINKHFKPLWYIKLKDAKPKVFEDLYYNLMSGPRKLSPNTIMKLHSYLHGAFRFAVKNDIIKYNPIDQTDCPKKVRYESRVPKDEEFEKLWDETGDSFDKVAIVLSGVMTLCRGEICGLKWSDLDRKNRTISVNETHTRFDKNIRKGPKAHARKRTIYAPQFVFDVIDRYRATLTVADEYICPYLPQSYSNHFKKLCDSLGLEGVTLHKMRHYCANIMKRLGIPDKDAAGRGGWSQVKTLQEVYQHFTDDADKLACEKIDEFFTSRKQ